MIRAHTLVFYDGHCGLCHRAVRFALDHDPQGDLFRYAPLQGSTFREQIPAAAAENLADSIVIQRVDGALLQQSDAILFLLAEIGGGWRRLGRSLATVPRLLRDQVYRGVARLRHLLFRTPPDLCPIVPSSIQDRFLP